METMNLCTTVPSPAITEHFEKLALKLIPNSPAASWRSNDTLIRYLEHPAAAMGEQLSAVWFDDSDDMFSGLKAITAKSEGG